MNSRTILPVGVGVVLLWLLVLLGLFPISLPTFLHRLIVIVPFLGIILFGIFSVFYLVYKVANLKDCPQAQLDLHREIERIKSDPQYRSLFRATTSTTR